jgi:eukaryotic-like serine/threonine-protein kinase
MYLGKYRLIAELGRGGMAEVFLAVTAMSGMFSKLVVLKKPREHLADDAEFLTMLVDEARIAARLNHPNLVQTLEVGEVNGQYFITMEYLEGQPLHRLLNRARATLPLEHHLTILADVLGGIHYAHELKDYDGTPLQIVHRDVTPHNVFITYEGQVKVVDFGIAKAAGRASQTRHGVVKGKTAYMAPEQASGRPVDRRVDVFAVGIMVYEAAIRGRLWKGYTETDLIHHLVAGTIPSSPKRVDPTVDDELDRICQRALAAAPDDRYESAAAFQRDLEQYINSRGPRPSVKDVGLFVAEIFADKRATTDKIVESQLAQWRSEKPRSELSDLTPSESHSSSSEVLAVGPRGTERRSGKTSTSTSSTSATSSLTNSEDIRTTLMPPRRPKAPAPARRPSRQPRMMWLVVAGLVLTIATAATTIVGFKQASSTTRLGGTATTAPPRPEGPITVSLKATPLETRFSIDDGPSMENPFIGTFPRDQKTHRIRAIAPGYPPKEETVLFEEDVSMRFSLSFSGGGKK